MSGAAASPTSTRSSPPIVIPQTPAPATPQGANATATPRGASVHFAAGPSPRNSSYNSPQPPSAPESKMVNAVKSLGRDMDANGILKELGWQTKIKKVKEKVMLWSVPAVFGMTKKGSPYINLLHLAAQFAGDPFNYRYVRGRQTANVVRSRSTYQK